MVAGSDSAGLVVLSADDGRAVGCGSRTTAASPGHVLAARFAWRPRTWARCTTGSITEAIA